MAVPVGMPKLGMTMREGKVVAWARRPGEPVEKGGPLLTIESEKAEVEIEAPAAGVLRHVYVPEGETVPCGTLLAAIAATADEPFDVDAFRREHDRPEVEEMPAASSSEPAAARVARAGGPTTPAARARARALGVDLERVAGTGPGGRVTKEDVERHAARSAGGAVVLDVRTEGQGDPVVLLPGFGSDVSIFARQVPLLAERFHVVAVNPRGVAGSDAPPGDVYGVEDAAGDVAALLDTPAHIVGASLGAAVAIELALTQPGLVRSLTLVTPFLEAPPRLLAFLDAWCVLATSAPHDVVARALVPWLFGARTLADPPAVARIVRGLAAMLRQVPATTLVRQAAGLRAWSGTRRGDLARIAVPTLVVVAEDDLVTPDAAAVAEAFIDATSVLVPGAGHAVMLEAPDEVNAALAQQLG